MDRSRLAVIIPCHNEAKTLGQVAAAARAYGEVIVVDDRSTDASRKVAAAAGAQVIASAHPGYDGAIGTGLRYAYIRGYPYAVTLDADGEHDPAVLGSVWQAFDAGAMLVCGVRDRPQRWSERLICGLARKLFGPRDILCGMKGYAREVLDAWFATGAAPLSGMAPTVIWRRLKRPFVEVPVTGHRRQDPPRFGGVLGANAALLQTFGQVLLLDPRRKTR